MEENLEKRFGLDAACVMATQSEMLFKARKEACELHQELAKADRVEKDLIKAHDALCDSNDNLLNCLKYACNLFHYACKKSDIFILKEDIEKELGKIPDTVLMYLNESTTDK